MVNYNKRENKNNDLVEIVKPESAKENNERVMNRLSEIMEKEKLLPPISPFKHQLFQQNGSPIDAILKEQKHLLEDTIKKADQVSGIERIQLQHQIHEMKKRWHRTLIENEEQKKMMFVLHESTLLEVNEDQPNIIKFVERKPKNSTKKYNRVISTSFPPEAPKYNNFFKPFTSRSSPPKSNDNAYNGVYNTEELTKDVMKFKEYVGMSKNPLYVLPKRKQFKLQKKPDINFDGGQLHKSTVDGKVIKEETKSIYRDILPDISSPGLKTKQDKLTYFTQQRKLAPINKIISTDPSERRDAILKLIYRDRQSQVNNFQLEIQQQQNKT
ncbi:hypothetical protein ABK040_013769 [Willaertia magna]